MHKFRTGQNAESYLTVECSSLKGCLYQSLQSLGHFAEEGEEKSVRAGGWEEAEEMLMSRCDMGFTFTNSQL